MAGQSGGTSRWKKKEKGNNFLLYFITPDTFVIDKHEMQLIVAKRSRKLVWGFRYCRNVHMNYLEPYCKSNNNNTGY